MKKIIEINNEEFLEDVFCDICGKSCKVYESDQDDMVLPDSTKVPFKEFSYMSMSNHWGYYSDKDWETWSAQVCESCVDKHLDPLIVFKKTDDMGASAINGQFGKGRDISDKDRQKKVLRNGRLGKLLDGD